MMEGMVMQDSDSISMKVASDQQVDSRGEKPIRVVHVAPCLGGFGGIESFTLRLAEEQATQKAQVSILWKRVKNFRLQEDLKGAMQTAYVKPDFVNRMSTQLYRGIADADIVHLHNPTPDATLFARMLGKTTVVTIYNHYGRGGLLHRMLWKVAARFAHRRWYISDFVWSTWEPDGRRAGSGKMPVVSHLPNEWLLPAQRKGFIFVGRWIENKGLEELVQAYGRADIDRQKWPLTLVGTGPLEERVRAIVSGRSISGVTMTGFVSGEERNRLIRSSKWMVAPPNTKEDLGLTPIESRHVGVPAIITRDGGLPEAGGVHCLCCEPGDVNGLTRLLEKAAAMTEAEYETISQATREELLGYLRPLSVYLDSYRALLQNRLSAVHEC
jgi:glycosyltransferase involved in cell wall biosynthesis